MEVIYSITNVLDGLISASTIVEPLLPIYEDRKRKFNLIEVVIHDSCQYKSCHNDSVQENKSKDLICDMV
jgi:hypothetical protein